MTANETLDRFLTALAADPETSTIAMMVGPYRAMAGSPEAVVATLDLLASMWKEAKG